MRGCCAVLPTTAARPDRRPLETLPRYTEDQNLQRFLHRNETTLRAQTLHAKALGNIDNRSPHPPQCFSNI
eukprot:5334146-Amphidinium_carterae.1